MSGSGSVRSLQPAASTNKKINSFRISVLLLLQLFEVLRAKLGDFGTDDCLTITLVRIALVILLVITLGRIELTQRRDFGHDRVSPELLLGQVADDFIGDGFLLGRMVEDRRTVLSADVTPLAVQ